MFGNNFKKMDQSRSLFFIILFFCVLSQHVIPDDVSEVGPDQSDRRGSARRASAPLIWVICAVRRRRLFLGAVFSGFSHAFLEDVYCIPHVLIFECIVESLVPPHTTATHLKVFSTVPFVCMPSLDGS